MADEQQQSGGSAVVVIGIVVVLVAVLAFLFLGRSAKPAPAGPGAGAPLRVAVIPKGTTHEFWKSIHAGAKKAEAELKAAGTPVEIVWKGPQVENDRAGQIDVVNNFAGQGVAGIVLAPLDKQALVEPVETAARAKIPVVIIDSALESPKTASFVATNNFQGGQIGGKRLGEVLGGKGKVLLLRYQEGSASTEQREAGFLDAIAKFPEIQVVSKEQYAGPTKESALTASQNLLNRFGQEVQGVFTPNESSTAGMAIALKDAGLAGKLKHVGFDASPPLVDALRAGAIQGLVLQAPFDMGYRGVLTCVAAIQGKSVDKQVDTAVNLVTPEDVDTPASKEALGQYLGR